MLQILFSAVPFVIFVVGAVVSTLLAATGVLALILLAAAIYTERRRRRIEAAHPPQGRFVEANGFKMHVLERNADAAGTPIVLLHGAASNADDIFGSAGAALAGQGDRARRIIAIDRPGHGYSERPKRRDASSTIVQARLIAATLEAMGVTRAIVLGHSWGGCLALTLALRHAALVEGLVLLAPVTHPWRGRISWYWRLSANRLFGPMFTRTLVMPVGMASIRPTLKFTFAPNAPPDDYIESTGLDRIFRPANFAANAEDMADLWDNVNWLSTQYGAIDTPTRIVQGADDPTLWPALHAESLVRQMPNAHLDLVPGVGHQPNYFARPAVIAAVEALEAASENPSDHPKAAASPG